MTTKGSELARVSIVDEKHETVLDMFVKPDSRVTDYVTQYSGITKEILDPVTTRLVDVHARLKELVSAKTILVGHSLENDLRALRVVHGNVADTALLFPHERGPPSKKALRVLALAFLNRSIQTGCEGHSSVEDALAAMELFQMKVANGPMFGVPEETGRSIFQLLKTHQNIQSTIVDRPSLLDAFRKNANVIPCSSDDECIGNVSEELRVGVSRFVWTQFHDLSSYVRAQHSDIVPFDDNSTDVHSPGPGLGDEEQIKKHLQAMDNRITRAWNALPPSSILIMLTGQANMNDCRRIWEWKKDPRNEWTEKENQLLEKAVSAARAGVAFIAVKPAAPSAGGT